MINWALWERNIAVITVLVMAAVGLVGYVNADDRDIITYPAMWLVTSRVVVPITLIIWPILIWFGLRSKGDKDVWYLTALIFLVICSLYGGVWLGLVI